jgi:2-polyprenyl-6-methoxyphenol hydroxylase-like FAD-dependent oxidoreductase
VEVELMSEHHDIDVLVVGAGPTGSALAADLVRRGVGVRLIDKAPHGFTGSRAKGLQPRTLEVFDDLGVLHVAQKEGGPYPLAGLHLGPVTVPWRMQQRNRRTADVPYPNILLLPQFRTDAILHRLLQRRGLTIEYGVAVETVEQDDDGVTATLSSGERVRSRYLVGADGGSSTVRKAAGLRFVGETHDSDRTLIIDCTIDELSRDRWHLWPRTSAGACPLPHSEQFQVMIRLKPDDTPDLDEAALAARFHKCTGYRLRDITWTSVFRPNVRLVERYRAGRVFVAGDAAHVHTPAGAQGLNTGVQDAYNLGWKLGQVLAGAPDSLLDSYDAERRPIAARVLGKSSELYQNIDQGRLAGLKRGDEERQISLSYRGGPLAPAGTAATKTLRPGDRAPDAPCTASGVSHLFDALRGPHFTLLAFGPGAAAVLPELAWPSSGAELRSYTVQNSGGQGHVLTDTTGKLATIYGVDADTLILIRPDGYIADIITADWTTTFGAVSRRFAPLASPAVIAS